MTANNFLQPLSQLEQEKKKFCFQDENFLSF